MAKIPGDNYDNDLYGTDGKDTITGLRGNDNLFGYEGNDNLVGNEDNDYLYGHNGKDTLVGGKGDDYLDGSYGNDVLTGGTGADRFHIDSPYEGVDTIKDFSWYQGDIVEIYGNEFGIGTTDYNRFSFNNDALYFDTTKLATLQPNSGFDVNYDISIV